MSIELIKNVYKAPAITLENYRDILEAHVRVDFKQADLLLRQGHTAQEFYIVESGLFRSFLLGLDGNEITTEFYCPGDILIESFSLFHRIPSKEAFHAVTDGAAWKIEYAAFRELLLGIEGLREWGRTWSTHQLYILKRRSIDALTIPATERYLSLIQERPDIIAYSPLKYIASYLGITDTSLSRIRKEIAST